MHTQPVLHWELYGAGSQVTFCAERQDDAYALTLRRDDALIMTAVAQDTDTLFAKSASLRDALRGLGYMPSSGGPASQLAGGVCWGPEPFDIAVLRAVR
jgi:hypothetical protein